MTESVAGPLTKSVDERCRALHLSIYRREAKIRSLFLSGYNVS
jgi:hypothetical protein